eukprot:gb/GEZN01002259.1/.p1 GENE.gb/GEZN01002259.1/~~gb/GEZN01002259.1/.p1  ORF type:complete len:710 (+),score=92.44 gb/GEZN01002259.1/:69-2198(+)
MSFFDEVETTVANTRFLAAVEDSQPIELQLQPLAELSFFEKDYRSMLARDRYYLLKPRTVRYYILRKFLRSRGLRVYADFFEAVDAYRESVGAERLERAKELLTKYVEGSSISKRPASNSTDSGFISGCHNRSKNGESRGGSATKRIRSSLLADTNQVLAVGYEEDHSEDDYNEEGTSSVVNVWNTEPRSAPSSRVDAGDESKTGPILDRPRAVGSPVGSTSDGDATLVEHEVPEASLVDLRKAFSRSDVVQALLKKSIRPSFQSSEAALAEPPAPPTLGGRNYPSRGLFDRLKCSAQDLLLEDDVLRQFEASDDFNRLLQVEHYARRTCKLDDFRIFRVLGRGAFGAVSAVQKIDTHAIYAMKEMGKKQVKLNRSEWMVIIEKKVLSKMSSPFVLNLKYSFHDAQSLYLIFDMCTGGDLKYHLRQASREGKTFSSERVIFYAAEVFLGLEHIHSHDIVYRDLKPNNILLTKEGHLKISDLGLAIKLRPNKILKHLAGTAGYWAPEIIMKTGTLKVSDFWSYGVFLYEMVCGKRPRCKCAKKSLEWCPFGQSPAMEENALKDDGVLRIDVDYGTRFSPEAKDLLSKLFVTDPRKRLGANGPHEVREHAFFASVDWEKMRMQKVTPPFVPDARTVHANSIGEVGEFSQHKYKNVRITEADEKNYRDFAYTAEDGVQAELEQALIKMDSPPLKHSNDLQRHNRDPDCCILL